MSALLPEGRNHKVCGSLKDGYIFNIIEFNIREHHVVNTRRPSCMKIQTLIPMQNDLNSYSCYAIVTFKCCHYMFVKMLEDKSFLKIQTNHVL